MNPERLNNNELQRQQWESALNEAIDLLVQKFNASNGRRQEKEETTTQSEFIDKRLDQLTELLGSDTVTFLRTEIRLGGLQEKRGGTAEQPVIERLRRYNETELRDVIEETKQRNPSFFR